MARRSTPRPAVRAESRIDPADARRSAARGRAHRTPSIDRLVADLASRQHGVIARSQLLAHGLTSGRVDHRVAAGRLHVLHAGVYAVGHVAIADDGRRLAAVLACGPGAGLSHASAVSAWCGDPLEPGEPLHVTATRRRARPGLVVHEAALGPGDVRRHRGVPVTSPARTLLDLAAVLRPSALEREIERLRVARVITPQELGGLVSRARGRRGAGALRTLLADRPGMTRSEAERRLLALIARAALPRPRTNVRVGRYEVDLLWPAQRLAVEVDGYRFHSGRAAFERDRRRDADLQASGLRVLRVTWRMLSDEPEPLIARLAAALAVAGAAAG